jgi:HK97 family phage major capsid protein
VNTSRDVVVVPSLASGVTWEWVDETTGPAGSQPSFGQLRVPVHTAMGKTQASNNLLEDSALNIEQLLATLFAESLAEEEDRVILAGTGNGEPEGILTNAEVEVIDTETAGQVKPDDFIELTYSLKDKYARNAVLLVARTAKKVLRKAKDSNGQYLWQPALSAGEPPTFDGYRVISPSVGLAEQITAGAKIAVFGDLRYYWVIERVGMTLQRLAELYAEQNQVGFVLRRRMGGKLMLPEAVKVLRVKAA